MSTASWKAGGREIQIFKSPDRDPSAALLQQAVGTDVLARRSLIYVLKELLPDPSVFYTIGLLFFSNLHLIVDGDDIGF